MTDSMSRASRETPADPDGIGSGLRRQINPKCQNDNGIEKTHTSQTEESEPDQMPRFFNGATASNVLVSGCRHGTGNGKNSIITWQHSTSTCRRMHVANSTNHHERSFYSIHTVECMIHTRAGDCGVKSTVESQWLNDH